MQNSENACGLPRRGVRGHVVKCENRAEDTTSRRLYHDSRHDPVRLASSALEALEEDAAEILINTLGWSGDEVESSVSGLRTLWINVTQGMLNQQLLTLTDARRQRRVEIGEKFKIRLPTGEEFETELCDPGNKLRERGMIRRFYETSNVEEGEKVILKEIEKGSWQLLTLDSPEGQAELDRKNPNRHRSFIKRAIEKQQNETFKKKESKNEN